MRLDVVLCARARAHSAVVEYLAVVGVWWGDPPLIGRQAAVFRCLDMQSQQQREAHHLYISVVGGGVKVYY